MKMIVLALMLVLPVAAQTPPLPPDRKMAALDDKVHLTDAQKAAIAPIVRSAEVQKHALGMMAPQQQEAAYKAIVTQERAKIRALLTADQQAKLDKGAAK